MPERPIPRTTTEVLLALVLDELGGIRADLATARDRTPPAGIVQEPAGTPAAVEVSEPAPQASTARTRTRTRPAK